MASGIDPSNLLQQDLGRLLGDEQLTQAYYERRQAVLESELGDNARLGGLNPGRETGRQNSDIQVAATSQSLRRLPSLQHEAFSNITLGADDMLLQAFRFARGAPDTRVLFVPEDEKVWDQVPASELPRAATPSLPPRSSPAAPLESTNTSVNDFSAAPACSSPSKAALIKRRARKPLSLNLAGASNKEPPHSSLAGASNKEHAPSSQDGDSTPVLDSARRDAILTHAHRPMALPDASVPKHLTSASPSATHEKQRTAPRPSSPTKRPKRLISGHLQSPEIQGVMRGIDSVLGALQNDSSDDEVDRVRWGRQAPPSQSKGWSKFSDLVQSGAWRDQQPDGGGGGPAQCGSGSVTGLKRLVLAAQANSRSAAAKDPREWQLDAIRVTGQKRRRRNRAMARRLYSEQEFLSSHKRKLTPLLSPAEERSTSKRGPSMRTEGSLTDLMWSASAPSLGSLQALPANSVPPFSLAEGGGSLPRGGTQLPSILRSAFDSARSADVDAALLEADFLLSSDGAPQWGASKAGATAVSTAAELEATAAARRARKAVQLRAYGGKSVHPAIVSAETAAAMLVHPATKSVKGGVPASTAPLQERNEANNPKSPYRLGVLSSTVNPRWRAWAYHYDRTQSTSDAQLAQSAGKLPGGAGARSDKSAPLILSTLPVSPMGREVAALRSTLGGADKVQRGAGGGQVRGPSGQRVHQLRMLRASAMSSAFKPLSPGTGVGTSISLGASSSGSAGHAGGTQQGGRLHRQLAKASRQWGEGEKFDESSSSSEEDAPGASTLSHLEGKVRDLERSVAVDEGRTRATMIRGGHSVGTAEPFKQKDEDVPTTASTNTHMGHTPSLAKAPPSAARRADWVLPTAAGLTPPATLQALGNWSRHPLRKWAHLPHQGAVTQHSSWAMRAARLEASNPLCTSGGGVATRPGPGMGNHTNMDATNSSAFHHSAVLRDQSAVSRRPIRQHLAGGDLWLLDDADLPKAPKQPQGSEAILPQKHHIQGGALCVATHPLPFARHETAHSVSGAAASEMAVRRLTAHLVHRAPPQRSAAPPKPGSGVEKPAIGRTGLLEAASDPHSQQRATVAARAADSAAHDSQGAQLPAHTAGSAQDKSQQQRRSHHVSATVALICHPSINPLRQVSALRSWTLTQLAAVAADSEMFGRTIPTDAGSCVLEPVFNEEGGDEDTGGADSKAASSAQLLKQARISLEGEPTAADDAVGLQGQSSSALPGIEAAAQWIQQGSRWAHRQAQRSHGGQGASHKAAVLSVAKARFFAQWQQLTRSPLSAVLEAGVALKPRTAMKTALADALNLDYQRLLMREEVAQAALEHDLPGTPVQASLGRSSKPLSAVHFLRGGVIPDDHPESTLAFLQQAAARLGHDGDDEVAAWSSNELLEGMWAARGAIHAASGVMEVCRSATAQLAEQLAAQCAEEGETLRLVWHDVRELWEIDAVLAEADAACALQDSFNVLASLEDLAGAVQQETAQSEVLLAVVESQYSTLAGLMQRTDDAGISLRGLSTAQLRSAAAILTRNAAAAGLRKDEVLSSGTIRSVLQSVKETVGRGAGAAQAKPAERKGGILSQESPVHASTQRAPPTRSVPLPPGTPKPGFDPSKVHLQQRGRQPDTSLGGDTRSLANAAHSTSFAFSDDDESDASSH